MTEWLSRIVIIAIVLVVLDGFRRKFKARNSIRLKIDKNIPNIPDNAEEEDFSHELPAGGARIRKRGEEGYEEEYEEQEGYQDEPSNSEDEIPVLNDAVVDNDDNLTSKQNSGLSNAQQEWDDTHEDDFSDDEEGSSWDEFDDEIADDDGKIIPEGGDFIIDDEAGFSADVDDAPASSKKGKQEIPEQVFQTELFNENGDKGSAKASVKTAAKTSNEKFDKEADAESVDVLNEEGQEEQQEDQEVEEVVVISVVAPSGQVFNGADILPVLLENNMRLGSMSIFHRHAKSNGDGPVMFSVANMVKPGTFDLAEMESMVTLGVSLFMQMPSRLSYMESFNKMLETAEALKNTLQGELKDENRSVLTRQTIEHYRQRIRDFELRQLSRK